MRCEHASTVQYRKAHVEHASTIQDSTCGTRQHRSAHVEHASTAQEITYTAQWRTQKSTRALMRSLHCRPQCPLARVHRRLHAGPHGRKIERILGNHALEAPREVHHVGHAVGAVGGEVHLDECRALMHVALCEAHKGYGAHAGNVASFFYKTKYMLYWTCCAEVHKLLT